ncbi:hypothetical protein OSB04_010776 [Centaurea solstitialis]|uniref:Uncharacterized protein n=1 Tax=Centaurea solstitialis TaxID=347529 RepID=A0AA38WCA6_9ASTR|nr:hypothetical protein OSB04_010776 [Centaurea solstitialis]
MEKFSTTKHTLSVSRKRSRDVEETVVVKKERITLTDEPSSWMAVWDDDWCFSNIQPLSPLSPLTAYPISAVNRSDAGCYK